MSEVRPQIRAALRWAPYSWMALPIVGALAISRYGWPAGSAGWLPLVVLVFGLVAVERGCLFLFSLASGERSQSPRDLGYQLTLALGFSVVLWAFREFMSHPSP